MFDHFLDIALPAIGHSRKNGKVGFFETGLG
jgi:hypothetical protein